LDQNLTALENERKSLAAVLEKREKELVENTGG